MTEVRLQIEKHRLGQSFRLVRGGMENQAYRNAAIANARMTPMTIKKSRTGAVPFEK